MNSDLSSATPRAFFYPLFVAFLYYQVRGSTLGMLLAIGLEALFFPPAALLSLGILAWDLLRWENRPWFVPIKAPRSYFLLAAAIILTLLFLLPYLHRVRAFGPTGDVRGGVSDARVSPRWTSARLLSVLVEQLDRWECRHP